MRLILDTNVFNALVDGKINIEDFEADSSIIYITHIQHDELNQCQDVDRRAKLLNSLKEFKSEMLSTESFILGTSRLGYAKLGDGNLLEKLRNSKLKHTNDALIGETAIKNKLILITNDSDFKNKVKGLGGKAYSVEEFKTR